MAFACLVLLLLSCHRPLSRPFLPIFAITDCKFLTFLTFAITDCKFVIVPGTLLWVPPRGVGCKRAPMPCYSPLTY